MSVALRHNRKSSDADIRRLNGVGLSLAMVAQAFDCHPSAITLRLKAMGETAADTRRAFMQDVFLSLEPEVQEWFADKMTPPDGSPPTTTLKQHIASLISAEYKDQNP